MSPSAEHRLVRQNDDPRNRQRIKVLQQAKLQQGLAKFSWQLESPDRSCEALSSYLVREKDIAIVDYVLEPLTGTTIPDVDVVDEKQVHAIIHAVTDLTNLMFTLDDRRGTPSRQDSISAYRSAVFPTLCEKWPILISWLRALMLHFWKSADASKMTGNCVELLKATLLAYRESGRAEELFSLPCTIDFVYLLVCRAEVYPGLDVAIHAVFTILGVLALCLESDSAGRSSFALRLSTVNEATRYTVVGALVRRAREFADHGCNRQHLRRRDLRSDAPKAFHVLICCTDNLLEANPSLFPVFMRHNFLIEYAESLSRLVKSAASLSDSSPLPATTDDWQEFWSITAQAITSFLSYTASKRCPSRSHGMAKAIEGGILTSGLMCLLSFTPNSTSWSNYESLKDRIRDISSSDFQFSKVVKAVAQTYSTEVMDRVKKKKGLEELYFRFYSAFHRGLAVFEVVGESSSGPTISLCDNHKHHDHIREPTGQEVELSERDWRASVKTCSRCHSATYCSVDCQEEDWKMFHKHECLSRSYSYQDQKVKNIWEQTSLKRDQLMYLEYALNFSQNLGRGGKLDDSGPFRRDEERVKEKYPDPSDYEVPLNSNLKVEELVEASKVMTLDLINYAGVTQIVLSIDECRSLVWTQLRDAQTYQRRIDAMVQSVISPPIKAPLGDLPDDNTESPHLEETDEQGKGDLRLVQGIFFHDSGNATVIVATTRVGTIVIDGTEKHVYQIVNSVFALCDPEVIRKGVWKDKIQAPPALLPHASEAWRLRAAKGLRKIN
ncbi:hypothetical protein MD484_g7859, partial [Candolleomyces efflorescens]